MRHSNTQLVSTLIFLVGSLVATPVMAEPFNHAGENGNSSGGMGYGSYSWQNEHGLNYNYQDAKRKQLELELRRAKRRNFNEQYALLTAEEKAKFSDAVLTAEGEYGADINQFQLVGFANFVKINPSAVCTVKAITKADRPNLFSILKPGQKKKFKEVRGNGDPDLADMNSEQFQNTLASGPLRAGLSCTANGQTKIFRGLPAVALNEVYNSNIQLRGETVTVAPVVADTNTTPTVTTPTPIPVPASSSTMVTGYMTQSTTELSSTQEQTAFESAPATTLVDAPATVGFSNPTR